LGRGYKPRPAQGGLEPDGICIPSVRFEALDWRNALRRKVVCKLLGWGYKPRPAQGGLEPDGIYIPSVMFEALDWCNALRRKVVCKLLGRGYKPRPAQKHQHKIISQAVRLPKGRNRISSVIESAVLSNTNMV